MNTSRGFSLFEVLIALILLSFTMFFAFNLAHKMFSYEAKVQARYVDMGLIDKNTAS